jgi:AbrB family looped-hinge helix DNA binding protein
MDAMGLAVDQSSTRRGADQRPIANFRGIAESSDMAKPLVEVVKLGKHGEIVLPRRLRNQLNLSEGDELVLFTEDKRIVLERRARKFAAYLDVMNPGGGTTRDE